MSLMLRCLFSVGVVVCLAFSMSNARAEVVSFQSTKMWRNTETLKIRGTLSTPKGQGPFPAVVLTPNCGGPAKFEFAKFWPKYLNELGYITLNVDHFGPRKQKRCTKKFKPSWPIVMQDAYGAYAYLARRPDVDKNRVAVLGSSLGAAAINWYTAKGKPSPEGLKFSAAVSLYPSSCKKVSPKNKTIPTIIILGDKERGIASCKRLQPHPKISLHIFPGIHHAFDQPTAKRRKNGRLRKDITGNKKLYSKSATRKAMALVKEFLTVHLAAKSDTVGLEESAPSRLGKVGGKDPYKAVSRRDTDSDGQVGPAEWEKSLAIFSKIDADGDGFLTPQEFHGHWKRRQ